MRPANLFEAVQTRSASGASCRHDHRGQFNGWVGAGGPRLQAVCYGLLAAGVVVLAAGLFLGFDEKASPVLVYILLASATLAFALVVLMFLQPGAFAFIGGEAPAAGTPPDTHPETSAEPHMDPVHEPAVEPVRARAVEPSIEPPPQPPAEPPVVPKAPALGLVIGLNTTLGEVLLQAIRADPEGMVRLLAGVIGK